MGRPRKYKEGWRTTCVMIPREYEELWHKATEIATREGKTLSEIISRALAEYHQVHYPGNPQAPLPAFDKGADTQRPLSLKCRFLIEDLERILGRYQKGGDPAYINRLKAKLQMGIVKGMEYNARLKNNDYQKRIESIASLI
jgi:hypothetical protein